MLQFVCWRLRETASLAVNYERSASLAFQYGGSVE